MPQANNAPAAAELNYCLREIFCIGKSFWIGNSGL